MGSDELTLELLKTEPELKETKVKKRIKSKKKGDGENKKQTLKSNFKDRKDNRDKSTTTELDG